MAFADCPGHYWSVFIAGVGLQQHAILVCQAKLSFFFPQLSSFRFVRDNILFQLKLSWLEMKQFMHNSVVMNMCLETFTKKVPQVVDNDNATKCVYS